MCRAQIGRGDRGKYNEKGEGRRGNSELDSLDSLDREKVA